MWRRLPRAVERRQWRHGARSSGGWAINLSACTFMLLVYISYACVFGALAQDGHSFLMSWLFSLIQRFIAMEPLIILIGVLLPLLFATEFCANACTESCNNVLGVGLAVVIIEALTLDPFARHSPGPLARALNDV